MVEGKGSWLQEAGLDVVALAGNRWHHSVPRNKSKVLSRGLTQKAREALSWPHSSILASHSPRR